MRTRAPATLPDNDEDLSDSTPRGVIQPVTHNPASRGNLPKSMKRYTSNREGTSRERPSKRNKGNWPEVIHGHRARWTADQPRKRGRTDSPLRSPSERSSPYHTSTGDPTPPKRRIRDEDQVSQTECDNPGRSTPDHIATPEMPSRSTESSDQQKRAPPIPQEDPATKTFGTFYTRFQIPSDPPLPPAL